MATRGPRNGRERAHRAFDGVRGGLRRGELLVRHEIEEERQARTGYEDDVRSCGDHTPRGDGAAPRGEVSEDDADAARIDHLENGALDLRRAHPGVRHWQEQLAATGDLLHGADESGGQIAMRRHDRDRRTLTHHLPGDTAGSRRVRWPASVSSVAG